VWLVGGRRSSRSRVASGRRTRRIETDFPSYILDEDYLTKVEPLEPDAKALDIEGMLDAEIRLRLDEDEDVRPLSERFDRIIQQKRAGTLAGIALLKELERLTSEVVEIVKEADRPVVESIAREVGQPVAQISEDEARSVADAIVARAGELCFPNWYGQAYMDTELYRELTILLATTFNDLDLHGPGNDFVIVVSAC
jgi:type I restriction enzyme R subunit